MGIKLSKEEHDRIENELRKQFAMLDANGDGYLDRSEYEDLTKRFVGEDFSLVGGATDWDTLCSQADENMDGRLTCDELVASCFNRFKKMKSTLKGDDIVNMIAMLTKLESRQLAKTRDAKAEHILEEAEKTLVKLDATIAHKRQVSEEKSNGLDSLGADLAGSLPRTRARSSAINQGRIDNSSLKERLSPGERDDTIDSDDEHAGVEKTMIVVDAPQ